MYRSGSTPVTEDGTPSVDEVQTSTRGGGPRRRGPHLCPEMEHPSQATPGVGTTLRRPLPPILPTTTPKGRSRHWPRREGSHRGGRGGEGGRPCVVPPTGGRESHVPNVWNRTSRKPPRVTPLTVDLSTTTGRHDEDPRPTHPRLPDLTRQVSVGPCCPESGPSRGSVQLPPSQRSQERGSGMTRHGGGWYDRERTQSPPTATDRGRRGRQGSRLRPRCGRVLKGAPDFVSV